MASFKGSGYLGLVVSIHLKNMRKSNGIIPPIFEVKIKILETNHREIIIKLLGLFSTHREKNIYLYIYPLSTMEHPPFEDVFPYWTW